MQYKYNYCRSIMPATVKTHYTEKSRQCGGEFKAQMRQEILPWSDL